MLETLAVHSLTDDSQIAPDMRMGQGATTLARGYRTAQKVRDSVLVLFDRLADQAAELDEILSILMMQSREPGFSSRARQSPTGR